MTENYAPLTEWLQAKRITLERRRAVLLRQLQELDYRIEDGRQQLDAHAEKGNADD